MFLCIWHHDALAIYWRGHFIRELPGLVYARSGQASSGASAALGAV
jgi:hypothetical protein